MTLLSFVLSPGVRPSGDRSRAVSAFLAREGPRVREVALVQLRERVIRLRLKEREHWSLFVITFSRRTLPKHINGLLQLRRGFQRGLR